MKDNLDTYYFDVDKVKLPVMDTHFIHNVCKAFSNRLCNTFGLRYRPVVSVYQHPCKAIIRVGVTYAADDPLYQIDIEKSGKQFFTKQCMHEMYTLYKDGDLHV